MQASDLEIVSGQRQMRLYLPRLRFQGKVVALLVVAVCVVQLLTLAVVQVVTERSVRNQLAEQLRVGSRVWERFHHGNEQQLLESVSVLADDFGFKAAVGSGDVPTMQSALANQSARLGADFGMLIDGDGRPIVSLLRLPLPTQSAAMVRLLEVAKRDGGAAATVPLGDVLYRTALVPVLAPTPIAWVALGDRIDTAYARDFSSLTGLQASFVSLDADHVRVYASSLPAAEESALGVLPGTIFRTGQVLRIELGGEPHHVLAQGIGAGSNGPASERDPLAVLLQGSLREALAPYAPIRLRILLLTGLVTLLALAAAVWLGRSVTRPLSRLVDAAQRIGRGDYVSPLPIHGRDELAQLGKSFVHMRDCIAEREAQILHQASHDPLTGLPNRRSAISVIEAAIARSGADGGCSAVLMLDLDRFKAINDTLGHAFGDQVLVEVAKRLCSAVREEDLVLRLGGDEFLLLLEKVERNHVLARATGLLQALREPLDLPTTRINLDASIGLALLPDHGTDGESLLRRADIALYDAKEGQRGVAMYRSGSEESHLRQLTLIADLRLAQQRGELHLQFQPKIDLPQGRVMHAEALLRWTHAGLGAIAPEEFIPLAEHSGSIHELTRYVFEHALAENMRWRQRGVDLGIAINLSAMDLMDARLVDYIEDSLQRHRVPPAKLILEVTESALMRDVDYAVRVLRRLHTVGVSLSIDDFGTGHSSLAQLKRLPVDELKIDKSFVMRLAQGSDDDVIVRSTIELGHNMGLRVIAEGVENAEGLALLHRYHCDMAQGFWFSRPLEGEALLEWCVEFERRRQAEAETAGVIARAASDGEVQA